MSEVSHAVNGTMVAVVTAIGAPLAAIAVTTSIIAVHMSSNNKTLVAQIETSLQDTLHGEVRLLAEDVASQAARQAELRIQSMAAEHVAAEQNDLKIELEAQREQIALLEAAIEEATATIMAFSPQSDTPGTRPDANDSTEISQAHPEALNRGLELGEADVSMGDAVAGMNKFSLCAHCHGVNEGQPSGIGPNLWGVYQSTMASVDGFPYSQALKAVEGRWTAAQLDQYLANPRGHIPGTTMAFVGLRNAQDRANVIAYLATLN